MKLSFLNEFTYFLNDEAIDRVVTNNKIRYVKLQSDEKLYGLNNLIKAMSNETYLITDIHIGDPVDNWIEQRDKIIYTINNIVGKNDNLLILGDLTSHTNTANIMDVVNFIKVLKCENLYLILGNNDIYGIESYIKMGFKAVLDRFEWKNLVFTHMPVPVYGSQINIHGHLHESIEYIEVDWHRHINIWDNEFKPIKLKDVLQKYNSGFYKGITISKEENDMKYEVQNKIDEIENTTNSVFSGIEEKLPKYLINESINQKYIYVCAFSYNSIFSTLVRTRTLSKYNHSAIALDSSLNPMYTYLRENLHNNTSYKNKDGFTPEHLSDIIKKDPNASMKVIAIPVTDEQYETACALIDGYVKNINDTRYDYGNIVANTFNVKRNVYDLPENTMVCSEFVGYILYSIGFREFSKSVNLTTPKDISELDQKIIGAKCIYEGKVKEYKK